MSTHLINFVGSYDIFFIFVRFQILKFKYLNKNDCFFSYVYLQPENLARSLILLCKGCGVLSGVSIPGMERQRYILYNLKEIKFLFQNTEQVQVCYVCLVGKIHTILLFKSVRRKPDVFIFCSSLCCKMHQYVFLFNHMIGKAGSHAISHFAANYSLPSCMSDDTFSLN